ncbi:MAG: hypothetical protein ACOC8F_03750 [Planctomycetota bacterium]
MPRDGALRRCWRRLNRDRGWPVALGIGALVIGVIPWLRTPGGSVWSWHALADAPWLVAVAAFCLWGAAVGVVFAGVAADDYRFASVTTALAGACMAGLLVAGVAAALGADEWSRTGGYTVRGALDAAPDLLRSLLVPAALMGVFVALGARFRAAGNSLGFRLPQAVAGVLLAYVSAAEIVDVVVAWDALPAERWMTVRLPDLALRWRVVLGVGVVAALLGCAAGAVGVAHAATTRRGLGRGAGNERCHR